MTAKQRRRKELLAWVYDQYDPLYLMASERFAEALSCESIPYDETGDNGIPFHHRRALTEFRHLRQDRRVAVCLAWLKEHHETN